MTPFSAFAKAYRSGRQAINFDDKYGRREWEAPSGDYAHGSPPYNSKPTPGPVQKHAVALYKHLVRKMGPPIGYGRHRITFANKHFVVKMPRNTAGMAANQDEIKQYKIATPKEKKRLAPVKRIFSKSGIPIVVMPKLDTEKFYAQTSHGRTPKKLNWVWDFDGGQVGYDRKGKLKAFDYGG